MRYRQNLSFLVVLCALLGSLLAMSSAAADDEDEPGMETLSAEAFLAEIRKPLRVDAWGEFTGRITYKSDSASRKGTLRVRVTFTPGSMHTQIVLNDVNVYALEQVHRDGQKVTTSLERPDTEASPGLFDFGIAPEDLSFSFIYWDFVEELPRKSSRLRECRVMRLANPAGTGTVDVWFNARHGFPMEAWWYATGEKNPWRKLELKGAKRHVNGLWFVKEMRLEGKDWKSQVKFDNVEFNPVGEQ